MSIGRLRELIHLRVTHRKADFLSHTFEKLGKVLPSGTQLHVEHALVSGNWAVVGLRFLGTAKNGLRFDNPILLGITVLPTAKLSQSVHISPQLLWRSSFKRTRFNVASLAPDYLDENYEPLPVPEKTAKEKRKRPAVASPRQLEYYATIAGSSLFRRAICIGCGCVDGQTGGRISVAAPVKS